MPANTGSIPPFAAFSDNSTKSDATKFLFTDSDLTHKGRDLSHIEGPYCIIPEHYFERQLASIEHSGSPRLIVERW